MTLLIIDQPLVRQLLRMPICIGLIEQAMRATSDGKALQPPRWIIDLPGDQGRGFGLMPGAMESPPSFGAKLTAVYPENGAKGLQSHRGIIALFETDSGAPVAIVHGGEVTAIRTAAASALATRLLARPEADDLAILGYGEQALQHLEAMAAVRKLRRVRVWGRSRERAEDFAFKGREHVDCAIEVCSSVEATVASASLICTVTGAREPILAGWMISPGAHVNVVGSSVASAREIDVEAVERSRFFVDYRPSTLLQGGEFLAAKHDGRVDDSHIIAEIGEILSGRNIGRRTADEITIYKSLGIPAEDLVCAYFLYTTAAERGLGANVAFS